MKQLKLIQITYTFISSVPVMNKFYQILAIFIPFPETIGLSTTWTGFAIMQLLFLFNIYVNIYLIKMALEMRRLFRRYGHVTDYKGEIFLAVIYFIYGIYLSYSYLLKRLVDILIIKTEFECSEADKYIWLICNIALQLSLPYAA